MARKRICRFACYWIAAALMTSCRGNPSVLVTSTDTMPIITQELSTITSDTSTKNPDDGSSITSTVPSVLPDITTSETLPTESQALLKIDTGLPVMYLNVDLSAVYQDKDTYQKGTLLLRGDWQSSDESYQGIIDLKMKGRGNSSWRDAKRSFHLQLESKMDLLGLGANKHWLLLGQSSDLSLMKNKLFYDLSGDLGLPNMQSSWVELVINNQHAGNYLLCEKINHSDNLVLPNGLIYELDTNYDEDYRFKTVNGQPVLIHTHKYLDALDEKTFEAIRFRIQVFENAVVSSDFMTDFQGRRVRYNEMIDLDSLVDYWLIQELSFNPSIFKNSTYFYQESLDDVYRMGPVWDIDQTTGDLELQYPGYDRWASILWGDLSRMDSQTRAWHKFFIHDPVFLETAYQAYWENHDHFLHLIAENGSIDQMREQLLPSAIVNYQIWQHENDAGEAKDDYKDLVRKLKAWLTNRIQWLDRQFESVQTLEKSLDSGGF